MPGLLGPRPPPNYVLIEAQELEVVAQKLKTRAMELGIWDRIVKKIFGLKPKREKAGMPPGIQLEKKSATDTKVWNLYTDRQRMLGATDKDIAKQIYKEAGLASANAALKRIQRIKRQEARKRLLELADPSRRST
jgi:hypothetical protein